MTFSTRMLILGIFLSLQGCIVGSVIEAAAETVEAGVEITAAVVGTAVDIAVPDGDEEED